MKVSEAPPQHSIEKRRHRRRRVWLPAILVFPHAEAATWIRDISCKGAMIETEAELAAGSSVIMLRKGIEMVVTVAWVRDSFAGIIFERPFAEKDLVEYSLPRAPLKRMLEVHGSRRPPRG